MIRLAEKQDIPALVEIGRKFYDLTPVCGIPFNEVSIGTTIQTLIDGDNSVVFVDEAVTGTIGGMVYPFWINTNYLMANESFWWSTGGTGLQLWTKLEEWAKSKGAVPFQMMALENSEPNRIEKVYKRRGYYPRERVFEKAL